MRKPHSRPRERSEMGLQGENDRPPEASQLALCMITHFCVFFSLGNHATMFTESQHSS